MLKLYSHFYFLKDSTQVFLVIDIFDDSVAVIDLKNEEELFVLELNKIKTDIVILEQFEYKFSNILLLLKYGAKCCCSSWKNNKKHKFIVVKDNKLVTDSRKKWYPTVSEIIVDFWEVV